MGPLIGLKVMSLMGLKGAKWPGVAMIPASLQTSDSG